MLMSIGLLGNVGRMGSGSRSSGDIYSVLVG